MTTSLQRPPPLKTRHENTSPVYLRPNNYYGSIGRPNHGRRKSAVELLQETKAFYVKSESVLDSKQEFKNADHLCVRSPTLDMMPKGPPPFPYSSLTCPPYPHHHDTHVNAKNYANARVGPTKVTAKITLIESGEVHKSQSVKENNKARFGRTNDMAVGSLTFTSFSQSGSLYSSLEKKPASHSNGLPPPSFHPAHHGTRGHGHPPPPPTSSPPPSSSSSSSCSSPPPPLPPKSPRPTRPHDFPQRLTLLTSSSPPPPRFPSHTLPRHASANPPLPPMTLPSPILPPTPPPDVIMESPMSDSGPIISPPPAFSTPVTPMLDRLPPTPQQRREDSPMSEGGEGDDDDSSRRAPPDPPPKAPVVRRHSSSLRRHADSANHQPHPPLPIGGLTLPLPHKQKLHLSSVELTVGAGRQPHPPPHTHRPILRSKSDLSHRYARARPFLVAVDLDRPSPPPPPVPIHASISTHSFVYDSHSHHHHYSHTLHPSSFHPLPKPPQPPSTLDRFFDHLGLSPAPPPRPLLQPDSPVFFSSVETIDSCARRSSSGGDGHNTGGDSSSPPLILPPPPPIGKVIGGGGVSSSCDPPPPPPNGASHSIVVHHGEPSIVERNARVIKWLFNCRKAVVGGSSSGGGVGEGKLNLR